RTPCRPFRACFGRHRQHAHEAGADAHEPGKHAQACLRPRDIFWDIPVPKIDSAFDNLFVPQPSW
ncbi:hypothetical protein, partial [Thiolapillus sp.]|uniref:hypothetical protein n=1 Tax=Thiolapillus sp. TaxID=2017437 RepID=UPI003AF4EC77